MTAPQPEGPGAAEVRALLRAHYRAATDARPGIPCEPDPADITAAEDRARGAVVNCRGWGCNRDECTTCAAIRDYYERLDGEPDTVPSLRREIARVTTELAQRAADAAELSRQIGGLIAELDRQARLREQAVQDWAGCRERLAEVEAERDEARANPPPADWKDAELDLVLAALVREERDQLRAQRADALALADEAEQRAHELVGIFSGMKGADVPAWVGRLRRAMGVTDAS